MKCDEFISNLETGSAVARLRARLHARRCPQCATLLHRLSELREALGAPAVLTPYHRRVWERVAVEMAAEPSRSWFAGPRLALAGSLALAATVVLAIALSVGRNHTTRDEKIAKNSVPPAGIETHVLRVSSAELAELEAGLATLDEALNQLTNEAELLEARRAICELAAMYPPLGNGDSS